jgi:hypothetical protein
VWTLNFNKKQYQPMGTCSLASYFIDFFLLKNGDPNNILWTSHSPTIELFKILNIWFVCSPSQHGMFGVDEIPEPISVQ